MNNSTTDRQLNNNQVETADSSNTPTTSATDTSSSIGSGLSQLVNRVDLQNILQSNTFLRSDLGNLIQYNDTNQLAAMNRNTIGSGQDNSENTQNFDQVVLNLQANNTQPNAENGHDHTHGEQPANNLLLFVLQTLQSSLPFFIILVAKIFHQHLLGFFIVLGFVTTLHWSNKTLVRQVELKDKKENIKLILLILFLFLNIAVFFLIFKEYQLYNW